MTTDYPFTNECRLKLELLNDKGELLKPDGSKKSPPSILELSEYKSVDKSIQNFRLRVSLESTSPGSEQRSREAARNIAFADSLFYQLKPELSVPSNASDDGTDQKPFR